MAASMTPEAIREISVEVKPIHPVLQRYGGKWWKFNAIVSGEVRPFSIQFPIRDRRVARRISRDTGQRFRMVNGYAVFRDKAMR